ncbi:MAG: dihydropteroate synthase [Candidatus Acidiferrales bacterium]|jgi:dihydropteroate synthase
MIPRKKFRLRTPAGTLLLGERTLIMAVLNVTPDSFSDGGQFLDPQKAIAHALACERAGADILDIGGESTRPGSQGVSAEEELSRVRPVLEGLRTRLKIPISLDTQKSAVAEAGLKMGVAMLNDVTGLRAEPGLAALARRYRVPMVLMHMRGEPRTMQQGPFARDVVRDVLAGLRQALSRAHKYRLPASQVILDPGIGFGKKHSQNFELLAHLPELAKLGRPILIGTSRKSFLGHLLGGLPEDQRTWATAATVTTSILGGAHIVRVHDVAQMVQVTRTADRIAAAL